MKKTILLFLTLITTIFGEGVFSVGNKSFGFTLGSSSNFNESYTVVGVNVNYFIVDNLSVGTEYKGFFGASPSIHQITVPVTYHLPLENMTYKPYIGAFFNQTFLEKPLNNYNIYGGRVGLSIQTSINSFISLGWVQEFGNNGNSIKNQGYPEMSGGLSF
jgi:outer membrane protein W